jgi:hypothetical protein
MNGVDEGRVSIADELNSDFLILGFEDTKDLN